MMEKLVLGIDTSNYTTSLALMNLEGRLISEARQLLPVQQGGLGLRQSDALFQHIKNLPQLFKGLLSGLEEHEIVAVCAATRPRPLESSYMPVFLAAESYGQTISHIMNIPFFSYSHQEGHIEAGLWSANIQLQHPFLAFHLSGGTTELLLVTPVKEGYDIDIVGGSSDISAGQLIDRIGVKLGLPFPAGPHLEELADKWRGQTKAVPISVKATTVSFSGPETFLQRSLEGASEAEEIAYLAFQCVGRSLLSCIKNALKSHQVEALLLVGGVASNKYIRVAIEEGLKDGNINVNYGLPKYCTDNAVGIGALGVKKYNRIRG